MTNMPLDQLENNRFVEGPGYPKSTVRTLVTNPSSNPVPISGSITASEALLSSDPFTLAQSVATSALKLASTDLTNRKVIVIRNYDPTYDIFLGDATVSTSTGFPLLPKEVQEFDMSEVGEIYAIGTVASGVDVRIMQLK